MLEWKEHPIYDNDLVSQGLNGSFEILRVRNEFVLNRLYSYQEKDEIGYFKDIENAKKVAELIDEG